MFWGIVWIVCAICASAIYRQKGRSPVVGFLAGVVLGPLGLLLAICSSRKVD